MLCTPMTTAASIFILQNFMIFSIFLLIFEQKLKKQVFRLTNTKTLEFTTGT